MRKKISQMAIRVVAGTLVASMLVLGVGGCGQDANTSTENTTGSVEQTETLPTQTEAPTEPVATEPVTENTTEESKGRESYTVDQGFESCWQIVRATTDVNVRTGASSSFDTIGLLKKGDQIQRYSIDPSWSQVVYAGQTFYIATQYLEVVSENVDIAGDPVLDTSKATATVSGTTPAPAKPTEAPAESSAVAVQPTPTPVPESSSSPNTSSSTKAPAGTYTWDQVLALDNTTIPFGTSKNDRDEKNIPNGIYYYNNLYSKYGADFIADTNSNTIYLTMDEGYEAGFTPEILDTLKAKNVKAVFFVTKQFVTENPQLVQRMIDEGHVLGNHSKSHPSDGMPSIGAEAEREDILWMHNYMIDNFGYEMHLFRYPTGAFSEQSLALVNSLGYRSVFWSFAHADWSLTDQPDEAISLQECVGQVHPGAIYLLHAVSATNTHILGDWIDGCRAKGYEFGVYPTYGFN